MGQEFPLLRRLLGYNRPYRLLILTALTAWLAMAIIDTLIPQFIARAIDLGIDKHDTAALMLFAALASGSSIVRAGANYGYAFLFRYWEHRVARDLRNSYYQKLMSLDWAYFDRATTGDLITRGIGDVDQMRIWSGTGLVEIVSTLGQFVIFLAVMFLVNWKLALLSMVIIPPLAFLAFRFGKGAVPMISTVQRLASSVTSRLAESMYGIRVVRAYGREPEETGRYSSESHSFLKANVEWVNFWAWLIYTMWTISVAATALVLGAGGLMVIEGTLTVGQLIAFNVYLARMLMAVRRSGSMLQRTAAAISSSSRFFAVIDAVPDIRDGDDSKPLAVTEGRVVFDHVSLRYARGGEVLQDISFEIPPGQTVALVGPTGSGKSSVAGLLGRFYDPTGGSVQIDGQDLRLVSLDSLRRQIAFVLQDVALFADTVKRNLAFARPEATEEQIAEAVQAAQATSFIEQLPEGYETRLGERGAGLSGGQRQRVTIARALLKEAPILVLDDSTSALDTYTEKLVIDAIFSEARRKPTTLIVAQRLSAARRADHILVIEDGRITQRGTHEELVRADGLYRRVWLHQESPDGVDGVMAGEVSTA